MEQALDCRASALWAVWQDWNLVDVRDLLERFAVVLLHFSLLVGVHLVFAFVRQPALLARDPDVALFVVAEDVVALHVILV